MSGSSRFLFLQTEQEFMGPDYFGFLTCELAELLSQDEYPVQLSPEKTNSGKKTSDPTRGNSLNMGSHNTQEHKQINDSASAPLFSDAIGGQLSEIQKERLRSLVRQSFFAFAQEVDEVLNPVLQFRQMQSFLMYKMSTSSIPGASSESNLHQRPPKMPKIDHDLQILLENYDDITKVEEIMKKQSDDLLEMIQHMEQKLEEFLHMVISQCRLMTLAEKRQLRKMIKDLPSRNLEHIVEITQHSKKLDIHSSDEIYVDLEKEDNVTLWRLYYYIKAVENARKLSKSREPC